VERAPSTETRFNRVFCDHAHAIRLYCIRRLDHDSVDDAVADVFATAWRRIDSVPDGDEALPYLYGIARNTVRNHLRSSRRRDRLVLRTRAAGVDPPRAGPEAQVVIRHEEREVLDALARLRPADQELLRLRTWEELSRGEIAVVLGISPGAVDMRLNRAMKHMAAALRAEGHVHDARRLVGEEEAS
jgi:RNA polymerase sigma-70 factor, ECF subfamily